MDCGLPIGVTSNRPDNEWKFLFNRLWVASPAIPPHRFSMVDWMVTLEVYFSMLFPRE